MKKHRLLNRMLVPVVVLSLAIGCGGQAENSTQEVPTGVNMSGRINYPTARQFVLERYVDDGVVPYDTIHLMEDNTFDKYVILESAGFYRLNLFGSQFINVILNRDDIQIVADGNSVSGFVDVSGSSELEQLRGLNERLQVEFITKQNQLNQQYAEAQQAGDTELASQIQREYMLLEDQKEAFIIKEIDAMGASLAVTQALRMVNKDKHFEFVDGLSKMLSDSFPSEPNVKQLAFEMDKMRKLAIGQFAPEISLPNPEGKIEKLSSLRGNYVLIDFWAEWCKPCRLENPNIVRAYKKYHDKGFEIFGVSLDRKKERWLKAIEEDGLHWYQVSDLRGWQSKAAEIYNITSIPASFLLDPEGRIIDKNLRGEALHNKLSELLDHSK